MNAIKFIPSQGSRRRYGKKGDEFMHIYNSIKMLNADFETKPLSGELLPRDRR